MAIGFVVAIASGIHHYVAPAHAAAAIAPGASTNLFDDTSGNLTHTNTACAAVTNPGQNFGNWVAVACSSLPANCLSSSPNAANVDYDVDAMVDQGTDPPNICLRAGKGDTITWKSDPSKNRNLKISHLNAAGSNNSAHPFSSDPPFGNGNSNSVLSPAVSNTGAPNTCYKFSAFIEVHGPSGVQCWDPHIYTDCDSSCVALGESKKGPKAKAPPKKK